MNNTELARLTAFADYRNLLTYIQIWAALRGDPVAIAENRKQVERIRQRERDDV